MTPVTAIGTDEPDDQTRRDELERAAFELAAPQLTQDACPRCGGTGTIGGRTGNDPQTSWHDDCSCQSWLTDADMVRDQTRPGK